MNKRTVIFRTIRQNGEVLLFFKFRTPYHVENLLIPFLRKSYSVRGACALAPQSYATTQWKDFGAKARELRKSVSLIFHTSSANPHSYRYGSRFLRLQTKPYHPPATMRTISRRSPSQSTICADSEGERAEPLCSTTTLPITCPRDARNPVSDISSVISKVSPLATMWMVCGIRNGCLLVRIQEKEWGNRR